ncbi:MAG: hypothetical protein LBM94_04190 [Propionibacteriaceae bacterium]|nr:hypothetical protein [Propionibacteriaceae bacterium]
MTDVVTEPMDIECPTCHGEGFKIVDTVAGLLRCDFCHNQWIDSRFAEGPRVERTMREHTRKGLFSKERTIETRE